MTDTRKEFGDWIRNFNLDSSSNYYRVAYESWQACQSLNDKRNKEWESALNAALEEKAQAKQDEETANKRIEQLLAVIELQRHALQSAVDCGMVPISSAKEGGAARYSQQVIVADKIREALALQPADVELSDIGYISEDGEEVFLTMGLPLDAETCGVPVTKLYTIKTKE